MSDMLWEDREESEMPIVLLRSAPIQVHFWTLDQDEATGKVRVASYFGNRLLATTTMDGEQLRDLLHTNAATKPARVTGLARYSEPGGALLLMLWLEVREDVGLFESEPLEFKLGVRHRRPERQIFPGNLEREARDLFGSILQGNPNAAIEQLFEGARQEASFRHEARLRTCGYPPGRDIAEGLQRNRIRQRGGNR